MTFHNKVSVVVFGGSNDGDDPKFIEIAYKMGELIAFEGYILATGAGLGMMEAVSRGAKDAGGTIVGVGLSGKPPNKYSDEYIEKSGIHARQSFLFQRGDAFIALPGGLGTLYEIIEIIELKKLKEDDPEPVVVLNHHGFFNSLQAQLEQMREDKFILEAISNYILFVDTPQEAIQVVKSFYRVRSRS